MEKERLLTEQRQLTHLLSPLERNVDARILRERLVDFEKLAAVAEPEELQRLLRWTFRRIEWEPEGPNRIQIYALPFPKKKQGEFATNVWSDGPEHGGYEPFVYRLRFLLNSIIPSLEIAHLTTQP